MPPSHTANSSAQFVQFGLDKQKAVGGALFELESLRAVSDNALANLGASSVFS